MLSLGRFNVVPIVAMASVLLLTPGCADTSAQPRSIADPSASPGPTNVDEPEATEEPAPPAVDASCPDAMLDRADYDPIAIEDFAHPRLVEISPNACFARLLPTDGSDGSAAIYMGDTERFEEVLRVLQEEGYEQIQRNDGDGNTFVLLQNPSRSANYSSVWYFGSLGAFVAKQGDHGFTQESGYILVGLSD